MKKLNLKKLLIFIIKLIIVIASWVFVFFKIKNSSDLPELLKLFSELDFKQISAFIFLLFLMLANWFLESEKWRFIISKIEKLSSKTALIYVWIGVSVGTITPNRIGEFVGRVMFLKAENRKKATSLTLISDLSQLLITIFFGSISIILLLPYFDKSSEFNFNKNIIYLFIAVSLILSFAVFFSINKIIKYLKNRSFESNWFSKFYDLPNISFSDKTVLFSLSLLRFLVFSFQYFLIFRIFSVEICLYHCFIASSAMFFASHLLPNIAIAEAGLRISFAILFFGIFTDKVSIISISSLLIYIINIIIPIAIGGINLLYRRKN
ncbi:MAG: flippase-like domain-containing protein [Bacteroidales bacterium]|nr:flippase-like domain-containing protein [Bacteroidales bacterium]